MPFLTETETTTFQTGDEGKDERSARYLFEIRLDCHDRFKTALPCWVKLEEEK